MVVVQDDPMDPVFRALADHGRRVLLDSLHSADGQTLGELCEALPHMTRFGVMKHLGVLEDAHLVTIERRGRSKHHYLNPIPIREVHDRWISRFAESHVGGMLALRDLAESSTATSTDPSTDAARTA